MVQSLRRIDACTVPATQSSDGEGMPQVMDSGWRNPHRDDQAKTWNQRMEDLADCTRVQVLSLREREKRAVGRGLAHELLAIMCVIAEALCHTRAEGDEPGFGELGVPDDQEIALEIDIVTA